jgi:hypothetical protein
MRSCVIYIQLLSLFARLDLKSWIKAATGFPYVNLTVAIESRMATLLALLTVSQIDEVLNPQIVALSYLDRKKAGRRK